MTVVLVHGNPETSAIWGPLIEELGRDDVVALSPPGFGAPLPDDFAATYLDYRDWLAEQLGQFEQPVDLVGHDWGGGHVLTLAIEHPELIRSWVSDVVGILDEDYVWHDLAQVWQTPGDGEQMLEAMNSGPLAERAEALSSMGIPLDVATELAAAGGPEMSRAILALYRSAVQPVMRNLELERAAARPGLAVVATEDTYVGTEEMRRRAAARAGAQVDVLDGLGHWWMLQDPARGAAMLNRFWGSFA
ncbi:MAG: alpha/beta hydrolase [Mycobacterium sp.]